LAQRIEDLDALIRGMDLFHVAVAIETASEFFLTFDRKQASLAKKAGLRLPALKTSAR